MHFGDGEIARCSDIGSRDSNPHQTLLHYRELRHVARNYVRRYSGNGSVQGTELVHMAWLRVPSDRKWENPKEFFSYTVRAMKNILLDRARKGVRQYKSREKYRVHLSSIQTVADCSESDRLLVGEALEHLTVSQPKTAKLIRLRFYDGLTNSEIAKVTQVPERTVKRKISLGRAYLKRRIEQLLKENGESTL